MSQQLTYYCCVVFISLLYIAAYSILERKRILDTLLIVSLGGSVYSIILYICIFVKI